MALMILFAFLLLAQSIAIMGDEFIYHHRRGLPRWEIIGHPLDTLSVIIVFAIFSFLPAQAETNSWIFISMFLSCLLITKDEWIHHEHCSPQEQWLHSVLFVLHPVVLLAAWFTWKEYGPTVLHRAELVMLFLFFIYQIVYWPIIYRPRFRRNHESPIHQQRNLSLSRNPLVRSE